MITGMDFVSLPVSDMARAKTFYLDTLQLKPGLDGGDSWFEFDLGEGPALALINPAEMGLPMQASSTITVGLGYRDFTGMVESLKSKDVLTHDPFESPVCHGAPFRDPDGNGLLLHQRKDEPSRDRVLDFVAVPIEDMQRARAFYEALLGLQPDNTSGDTWTEYVLPDGSALALGDVRPLGMEFKPIQVGGVALRTPDLEAVFERLKQSGHAAAPEIIDTPVCHMAMVKDSEGNVFLLHRHK